MSLLSLQNSFNENIELTKLVEKTLLPKILAASQILLQSLRAKNKILCCGNGGSASDASHFVAELVGRFQVERLGLPAIALTTDTAVLTAIANDFGYEDVFARQVSALGREGDVLVAISTSGCSKNVVRAIHEAHKSKMHVIALTGCGGGVMRDLLNATDVEICIPSKEVPRIQELHGLIIHCLCDLVDNQI